MLTLPESTYSFLLCVCSQYISIHIDIRIIFFFLFSYHFASQTKAVRQKRLSSQYRFNCRCDACENDYSHFHILPKLDIPDIITEADIDHLKNLDFQYATNNFFRYKEYLDKYGKLLYPCDQLCAAEECLKMAWKILVDAIPLKAKFQSS